MSGLKTGILSVVTIMCGLAVCETILRVSEPIPLVGVQLSPCNIIPDPLLKARYKPSSLGHFERFGEIDLLVAINNLGFHDRDRNLEKGEVFRVAVIGDSFTTARSVPIAKTWAQLAENRLTKHLGRPIEVVNLGLSGTGTSIHARIAAIYLPLLSPDLLLHVYTVGDRQDDSYPGLVNECYHGFVLVYQDPSARKVLMNRIDKLAPRRLFGWMMRHSYTFRAINFYAHLWPTKNVLRQDDLGFPWRVDPEAVDTVGDLSRMQDLAASLGAKFVTMPMPLKGLGSPSGPFAVDSITEVSEAARLAGVGLLDVRRNLDAEIANRGIRSKDMFWRYDGHHNQLGNDVLASAVVTSLLAGRFVE